MPNVLRVVPLLLLLPLLSGPHPAGATATPALPAYCELAGTVNRWQGLGVGPGTTAEWENDANWSTGDSPVTGVKDVCIPDGGQPRIEAGEESHLHTLDIETGARLTVAQGGKLFLFGSQAANEDSVVRSGGHLDVIGATFGGIAKLHVLGTMVVKNNGEGAASTLLVRDCAYDPDTPGPSYPGEEVCTDPATPVSGAKGLVEVADTGVLDVQGAGDNQLRGNNLGDQFQLIVRGLLRVRAGTFLAADHGTRLELRPHLTAAAGTGTLRFEGTGGYLEGKIFSDTGIHSLSTLVNQGRIVKTAASGSGRVLVTAAYSQPAPGGVSVLAGSLLLPTGSVTPAYADAGVTYGTGRCFTPLQPTCTNTTTSTFPQSAQLRVPPADASGASVVVRKLATKSSTADLGRPFEVHATGLAATAGAPAVISMRFDATVLNGKRAGTVKIYRKSGTAPYRLVRACTSTGRPQAGEVACVDRRGLAGSSRNVANTSGAPDVIMVIRTTRTSRWSGR